MTIPIFADSSSEDNGSTIDSLTALAIAVSQVPAAAVPLGSNAHVAAKDKDIFDDSSQEDADVFVATPAASAAPALGAHVTELAEQPAAAHSAVPPSPQQLLARVQMLAEGMGLFPPHFADPMIESPQKKRRISAGMYLVLMCTGLTAVK